MTLSNLTITTATVNEAWLSHARPIIVVYLAMEEACMASAICEVHYGRTDIEKQRTRDYREADGYRKEAQASMLELIEGIRDNYLCDAYAEINYDAGDDAIDAAEAFNTELAHSVVTSDVAVRMVGDEA